MLPLSDAALQSLTDALLQGRKIEAIKRYRELTGLGLKESKDAIEEIETSLRLKFPNEFAARPKTSGCAGAAVWLIAGVSLAGYWWLRR